MQYNFFQILHCKLNFTFSVKKKAADLAKKCQKQLNDGVSLDDIIKDCKSSGSQKRDAHGKLDKALLELKEDRGVTRPHASTCLKTSTDDEEQANPMKNKKTKGDTDKNKKICSKKPSKETTNSKPKEKTTKSPPPIRKTFQLTK